MANGAGRLFDVMKKTGEASKGVSSKLVSLKVKSKEPLIFQIDDRLEITEEFCYFSNSADKELLNIGDIVVAVALNNGQSYYIQHNLDGLLTTVAELNFLQGATDNIQNQIDKIKTSGVATGDTLPIGSVVEFTGDQVPENWEEVEYNELIVKDIEPTTGQEVWLQKTKNLINTQPIQNTTVNGVTITNNKDGTITFNGTCTAGFAIVFLAGNIAKLNGNHTFSVRVLEGSLTGYAIRLSLNNKDSSSSVDTNARLFSVVLPINGTEVSESKNISDIARYLCGYINTNSSFSNCRIGFQLEEGTLMTNFTTYSNNNILTKKENDKYEQFIEENVIVSSVEPISNRKKIWIETSKNLFNKSNYTIDGGGCIGFNLDLVRGKTYTISSNKPLYVAKFSINNYDANNNVGPQKWGEFKSWTFVAGDNVNNYLNTRIFLATKSGTIATNISEFDGYDIQVEEGKKATYWEEHTDNKIIHIKNDNDIYETFLNKAIKEYSLSSMPEHSSGVNSYSLFKFDRIVSFNTTSIWINSIAADTWISIGTLPYELRPKKAVGATAVINDANGTVKTYGKIDISVEGLIRVKTIAQCTSLSAVIFSTSWHT